MYESITIGIDNYNKEYFQQFVLKYIIYNTKIQVDSFTNDGYEITLVLKNTESIIKIRELIQQEEIWLISN